jgi:hypothetical protein
MGEGARWIAENTWRRRRAASHEEILVIGMQRCGAFFRRATG